MLKALPFYFLLCVGSLVSALWAAGGSAQPNAGQTDTSASWSVCPRQVMSQLERPSMVLTAGPSEPLLSQSTLHV